jgi:TonB family protein
MDDLDVIRFVAMENISRKSIPRAGALKKRKYKDAGRAPHPSYREACRPGGRDNHLYRSTVSAKGHLYGADRAPFEEHRYVGSIGSMMGAKSEGVQIPDDRRDKEKDKRMKTTTKRNKRAMYAMLAVALSMTGSTAIAQEHRKAISRPAPAYPEIARKMKLSGAVKVQVVISADGQIKETRVIGGHPIFVSIVQDTLKNWKYVPASGETTLVLEFNFQP